MFHLQKNERKSLSLNFSLEVDEKLRVSDFAHLFEDDTKVKRPSEIKPPLTCRVVLLLNRKIILNSLGIQN